MVLFYALIELCMGAALACGICHWGAFALVSAFVLLAGIINRRRQVGRAVAVIAVIALFIGLVVIDVVNWPGFRVLMLRFCLDIVWSLLSFRALRHAHLADRAQVALLSVLPLVCVAYSLPATSFMAFMLAYFLVWMAYLCVEALTVPTSGSVAIPSAIRISGERPRVSRVSSGFVIRGAGLLLVALVVGSLLFLVVPRWGVETLPPVPGGGRASGQFPDVALDRTGRIDLDPTLVFRADVPEASGVYYWRVDVQTVFDGVHWRSNNPTNEVPEHPLVTGAPYRIEFAHDWHDYKIPTLYGTSDVRLLRDDNELEIRFYRDNAGVWYRWGWRRGQALSAYEYWFGMLGRESLHFNNRDIWPTGRRPARARLTSFAREIAGDASGNAAIAARVQAYLRSNYQYSLDRPERSGSIVEDFLFNQKYGHCEMFSTAMAVLLARLDVPVRNVTGFVSSEFRDGQNYVRSAHAHSWVEVWTDDAHGWTVYDPTPSGPQAVEINWLVRIDDWFSAYKTRDFYAWMRRNGFTLLGWLAFAAVFSVLLFLLVGWFRRRLVDPRETYRSAWSAIAAECRRRGADYSLETWWSGDVPPALREVRAFAREYISACYRDTRDAPIPEGRFTRNDAILSGDRRALRAARRYRG